MARIKDKNYIVDEDNNITFIDQYKLEHNVVWDKQNDRYLFSDGITATNYVNATNSHIESRAPTVLDNQYIVPTIWVNSITLKYYILRKVDNNNNADWQQMAAGTVQSYDPRLTINTGVEPTTPNSLDMWVVIE